MNIEEYNQCVQTYSSILYRFLLKNIRDRESCRDIVQEAFEKLWLCIEKVPVEKAKSYLFTVSYHKMIDAIRKARNSYLEEQPYLDYPAHGREYNNLKELLDKALDRLPEIQRSLVILRDYEDYSYKEIAEITSLSESQVKVYLFRARQFLKKYLVSLNKVNNA